MVNFNSNNDFDPTTASPITCRPDSAHDNEHGTTYLAPAVHHQSSHRHQQQRGNDHPPAPPDNNNNARPLQRPTHHRQNSDPPARHIREQRVVNDEPSSFYVNHHGVMQPMRKRPVLAQAQVVEDEASQFHQLHHPSTIQEDDEMSMSMDSIGDAWNRRRTAAADRIVAVPVEASAATQQDDPSLLQVSQSHVLPVHEEAYSVAPHDMPRRRQFARCPVSGLTQASVLSEHTWQTHDQFRSGLALADPIYEDGGNGEDDDDDERAPVLAAMEQFSNSQQKLQAEEEAQAAARVQAQQAHTQRRPFVVDLPRLGGRTQSSPQSSSSATPPPVLSNRATSEPFAGKPTSNNASVVVGKPNSSSSVVSSSGKPNSTSSIVSSSAGTSASTESQERLDRMKKNRVRLQRGAAVGGLVAGAALGPVGAVALAAGGYAVTRLAGRRRERKMREQLEEEENVLEHEDVTHDETQSDSQADYEIPLNNIFFTPRRHPREDELEEKITSRFKAEGRHHLETSRLTTTTTTTSSLQSHPSEVQRRRRRNG